MKAVSVEEAVAMIPPGASIMVGGFMGVGTPQRLLDELVRQKTSGLTLISNDAATPGKEILHPVAVTIFGGLIGATALDAFLTPILLLRFGRTAVEQLRSAAQTENTSASATISSAPSY